MARKIRTAFFGGSFNPIHEGHLALAKFLSDNKLADEIWFVVSPKNPLKETADPDDAEIRYKRVVAALKDMPFCSASDIEFNLPIPSYTIDTLRYAELNFPEREFILLIGGDNLDVFEKWKDYQYILNHYDILVYPRIGATNTVSPDWHRVTILDAPMMDISSTELRGKNTKMFH